MDVFGVTSVNSMFRGADSFNQDIGGWDVSSVDDFNNFLGSGAELSLSNYDALLIGWSQLDLTDGLTFDAPSCEYTDAAAHERQSIIDEAGWTINDGGLANEQ